MNLYADRIVSVSAILVSFATLILILYQTNLERQEQKASVMLYLEIGYNRSYNKSGIVVVNKGLGPAKIISVKLQIGEEFIESDPYTFALENLKSEDINKIEPITVELLYRGRLIGARERLFVFGHSLTSDFGDYIRDTFRFHYKFMYEDDEDSDRLVVLQVEYESIYGDRWISRSDEPVPIEVDL